MLGTILVSGRSLRRTRPPPLPAQPVCSILRLPGNSTLSSFTRPGSLVRIHQLWCRATMTHTCQSRPDSGLGAQAEVLNTFPVVLFSLDSGRHQTSHPKQLTSPARECEMWRYPGTRGTAVHRVTSTGVPLYVARPTNTSATNSAWAPLAGGASSSS